MDRLLQCLGVCDESDNELDILLGSETIGQLTDEDVGTLFGRCLSAMADSSVGSHVNKQRAQKIITSLVHHRVLDADQICSHPVAVSVSRNLVATRPADLLDALEHLLRVADLEPVAGRFFSVSSARFVRHCSSDLSVLSRIAAIARSHPICLPPPGQQIEFVLEIISRVASLDVPKDTKEIISFVKDVTNVAAVVERIWMTSPNEIVIPCLSVIYSLIVNSSIDKPPPKTLAAFLQIVSASEINAALERLLNQGGLSSDVQVTILASVLCDWLIEWPKAVKVSNWLLALFELLTLNGRSCIVADVILQKSVQLVQRSWIPVVCNMTLPVLKYMLLTFRHSDQVLRKLAEPAAVTLTKLQPWSNNPVARTFRLELGEVFHLLIDTFPNCHSYCHQLRQHLADVPKPTEQRISLLVSSVPVLFSVAEGAPRDDSSPQTDTRQRWISTRSATGKVGLINLGNTCYVNCILQALGTNHDFTRALLEAAPTPHQITLVKLQQVMAFLLYSFRSVYSPAAFVKVSRPPWFEAGRQQDCSEFLRYLLDSLYEQERQDRSLVQCDERWTISGPALDCGADSDEAEGSSDAEDAESRSKDGQSSISLLQRWITEEDLTVPQHLSADNEEESASAVRAGDTCLSNLHSESTDSGIQSVGDATESPDKTVQEESQRPSLVHRIFGGKMTTCYLCLTCRTESLHRNFFTDLPLAFPDESHAPTGPPASRSASNPAVRLQLETLLDFFLATEKLQGDNRYRCDKCAALRDAERTLRITEAPQHLLLTLLRFRYDRRLQRHGKITTQINYPPELAVPVDGRLEHYQLYAVVIHSGLTLDGGHYYTFARSDWNADSWLIFNDSQVSAADYQTIVDLSTKYPMDTPYLLWYRRRTGGQLDPGPGPGPQLLPHLKDMVDRDNLKYMQEREQEVRRRNVPARTERDDPDPDDSTMPRFVF